LVHFAAIWWQLFVGLDRNFATKIEPNCQLQCAHVLMIVGPTVLSLLLSNEHALAQLLIIKITSIVRAMTVTTYKKSKQNNWTNTVKQLLQVFSTIIQITIQIRKKLMLFNVLQFKIRSWKN